MTEVPALRPERSPETDGLLSDRVTQVLEHISEAFCFMDKEWRLAYVNVEAERFWGCGREDLTGRRFWGTLSREVSSGIRRKLEQSVERGIPTEFEVLSPALGILYSGRIRPSADGVSLYLRNPAGYARDTDHLRKLDAASRLFAESINDYETLLQVVAECLSEFTGDTCSIRLLSGDGFLLETAAGRTPVGQVTSETELLEEQAWRILMRERRILRVPVANREVPADHPKLRGESRYESPGSVITVVPLVARGRFIGGVSFVRNVVGKVAYDEVHEGFLRDLCNHAALAIDNARLCGKANSEPGERENIEERYRSIFENAPLGICRISRRGVILAANAATARIFGYESSEDFVTSVSSAGDQLWADPGRREEYVREVMERGSVYGFEAKMRRRDGIFITVSINARAVTRSPGGELEAIEGTVEDVTARRQAEDACQRLAAIIESSEDAIIGKTVDGIITDWNEGAERLYGYAAEEAVGRHISILAPPERPGEISEILRRLRCGERIAQYETVRMTSDGRRLDVSLTVSPVRDQSGEIVAASTIAHDITERKRAEEELRRSHALLNTVIEGTGDAIFVKDLRGCYLLANDATAQIVGGPGCTAADLVGRDDTEFFPPEVSRPLMELDRLIMETGKIHTAEENVPTEGVDHVYLSTKAPYRDHCGGVAGVIGFATDITDRKRAEQDLIEVREAERRRIARDLHDTVLHHIVGVLQTMQATRIEGSDSGYGPDTNLTVEVAALREAVRGLRNAIYDLRLERNQPLADAIYTLLELNRQFMPGCEFVMTVEDGLSFELRENVRVELIRMVQEALTNARRHSGASRIEVKLGTGVDGDFVAEVSDDGQGFDRGHGSGVGLSIMRERALVTGACLTVDSVPGKGTRLRISVPVG